MFHSASSQASAVALSILAAATALPAATAAAQDNGRRPEPLSACMDRAVTNAQMQACAAAEYRRQDDRLNLEYRRARARLNPSQFVVLRQEQRDWLSRRGAECRTGGGSNGALSAALCRATETGHRADYLANYRASGRPGAPSPSAWTGRWQGPEGLFLEVQETREPNAFRLVLKDNLDDQNVYAGRFTGSSIQFQRRGRTETIRRGTGAETGFSFMRSRRHCLIVVPGREGYCRPN